MTIVEKFKKHSLISLIILFTAGVTTGWTLSDQLIVRPLQIQFDSYKQASEFKVIQKNIQTAFSEQLSIDEGTSQSTKNGELTINYVKKNFDSVNLSIFLGKEKSSYTELKIGSRTVLKENNQEYYIDINRFRGNIADIRVSKKL